MINADHCTGCSICVKNCISDQKSRESKYVVAGDCSLCGACVDHCPFDALKITAQMPLSRKKVDSKIEKESAEKERIAN
ncbi:4Fe-4S binding protein [Bacillus sp. FJAT-49705]|uniref:4Fe-4S binding protein n=1 Tax=Cytobacillus citreus TaxID=2833586 RepID=A0ABS5NP61_9BACI|nr:4Fe-4S binding protein [Cytobacillus citreus]MBS4189602.1 4Fe-4S binding protein [Cytobacillus citreus]